MVVEQKPVLSKTTFAVMMFAAATFFMLAAMHGVSANYDEWSQLGGNNQNSRHYLGANSIDSLSVVYTQANPANETPLVLDTDGDGRAEVWFMTSSDTLGVMDGNTQAITATVVTGRLMADPASCDIDGDGNTEYVGLFNESGIPALFWLHYEAGQIGVVKSKTLIGVTVGNETNVACGSWNGNVSTFFLDSAKRLIKVSYVGTILTNETITHALATSQNSITGNRDNQVLLLDDFDPIVDLFGGTNESLIFTSGRTVFTYNVDNTISFGNFSTAIAGDSFDGITLHAYRPSPTSKQNVIINIIHPGTASVSRLVRVTQNQAIGLPGSRDLASTGVSVAANGVAQSISPIVIGSFDDTSGDDIGVFTNGANSGGMGVVIVNGGNLQKTHKANGSSLFGAAALTTQQYFVEDTPNPKMLTLDVDKDGSLDFIVGVQDGGEPSNAQNCYYAFYGPTFRAVTKTPSRLFCVDEGTGSGNVRNSQSGIIAADINNDSSPDLIGWQSHAGQLKVATSRLGNALLKELPFSVVQNGTSDDGLTVTTRITTLYADEFENSYPRQYALVCDIKDSVVWATSFTSGFNTTDHPEYAFAYVVDPTNVTSPLGIIDNLSAEPFSFSMTRNAAENEFMTDFSQLTLTFGCTKNCTTDVFVSDDAFNPTYWLRINKTFNGTSTLRRFTAELPGGDTIPLANVTSNGDKSTGTVGLEFSPTYDAQDGRLYFTTRLLVDNVSIANLSTIYWSGNKVGNVQLYATDEQVTNSILTIRSVSLVKTKNPRPNTVSFSNGIRITEGDLTTEINSPEAPYIQADGFSVQPDFNQVFFSTCTYSAFGNYTQRHYLLAPNGIDYANYHDVRVTAAIPNNIGVGEGATPPGGDNDFKNILTDFFGITSVAALFMFWLVITILVAYAGFKVHWTAGIIAIPLMLIAGWYFGFVSVWVVVVIALIAAGIFAMGLNASIGAGG